LYDIEGITKIFFANQKNGDFLRHSIWEDNLLISGDNMAFENPYKNILRNPKKQENYSS
jgi:hypothetical protein